MPGLVRKLLICAAADGLLLQPLGARDRNTKEGPSVLVAWGTNKITTGSNAQNADSDGSGDLSLESYGVVGFLNLLTTSYLISITKREQVATIRKTPIYTIKDVTLIPLSSRSDATRAIDNARQSSAKQTGEDDKGYETDETDVGDDAETSTIGDQDEHPPEAKALDVPKSGVTSTGASASVARDVIKEKGRYGRFAESWFSRGGWSASGRRNQGLTSEEDLSKQLQKAAEQSAPGKKEEEGVSGGGSGLEGEEKKEAVQTSSGAQTPKKQLAIEVLAARIVRSTVLYFSSSSFFFSYDFDLSASLAKQDAPGSTVPLWKRFNEVFFWNRHLMKPLIDAGRNEHILPLLQGFVGQRAFSIAKTDGESQDIVADATAEAGADGEKDEPSASNDSDPASANDHDFLLTLISRRSTKRAGLRYLRRGIDDDGNSANFVETEQLLATTTADEAHKAFSLVQIRGSIPLFFSQSPYSFKPIPEMHGSESSNQTAFQKHFAKLLPYYGAIQCASLVDKHGTEVKIGEAYEKHAGLYNEQSGASGKKISFEWFDFHSVCKGMKFENVSVLMETLSSSLASFGWTEKQNEETRKQQSGVLRTNCMDCLDRTNVVQSAVAGRALQQQLSDLGLNIDLQTDPKTQWFNTLWADNGDAISRQYAGTAALKGDFTRTRKRHWIGALSDFSLTLNRYYNNIFGDYFLQTIIDYELGNAGPRIFDEFESNMMSQDYAVDMQRVRHNAIDSCIKMVLEDPQEDLIAGWTLSCPREANTLRSLPFEECVLLLTDAALYFCRFDWDTEKVGSFERVDLLGIEQIWRGVYITSAFGDTNLDDARNVGFAFKYKTSQQALVRTNTRSLQNEEAIEDEAKQESATTQQQSDTNRTLAFKALPPKSSAAKQESHNATDMSEAELVKHVCDEVHRAMTAATTRMKGTDHLGLDQLPAVEERDVISVADAKKGSGYLESLGYGLKKLVWS